jgi:hypothetical protein
MSEKQILTIIFTAIGLAIAMFLWSELRPPSEREFLRSALSGVIVERASALDVPETSSEISLNHSSKTRFRELLMAMEDSGDEIKSSARQVYLHMETYPKWMRQSFPEGWEDYRPHPESFPRRLEWGRKHEALLNALESQIRLELD